MTGTSTKHKTGSGGFGPMEAGFAGIAARFGAPAGPSALAVRFSSMASAAEKTRSSPA